jgi:hypothetical protein
MTANRACAGPGQQSNGDELVHVILNGVATDLASRKGRSFVADFIRATEKTMTLGDLKTKHRLTTDELKRCIADDSFIAYARAERDRRAGNGTVGTEHSTPDAGVTNTSPASRSRRQFTQNAKTGKHSGKRDGAVTRKTAIGKKRTVADPATSLIEDRNFLVDFARFSEGLLEEKFLRRKYKFDDSVWQKLGTDDKLVEAIEDERLRRIRDGSAARENAQKIFTSAPGVMGSILNDNGANAKHRIEASRELRTIAANGPEAAAASERFIIQINLGSDVEIYNKSRSIHIDDPEDISTKSTVIDTDDTDNIGLAVIASRNKSGSDNDGGRSI